MCEWHTNSLDHPSDVLTLWWSDDRHLVMIMTKNPRDNLKMSIEAETAFHRVCRLRERGPLGTGVWSSF